MTSKNFFIVRFNYDKCFRGRKNYFSCLQRRKGERIASRENQRGSLEKENRSASNDVEK